MKFRQQQRAAQQSSVFMVGLFILLVIALVVVANVLLVFAWTLLSSRPVTIHFYIFNTAIILLYVVGSYLIEVYELQDGGAKLAMKAGGREVQEPQDAYEKRLCNVVMEVAVAAGSPDAGIKRVPPLAFLLAAVFMLVGWMSWFAGRILSACVSRQREYLADASAVKYTRLTEGLASALKKIVYQQQYTNRGEIERVEARALAPMFLNFAFSSKLLATHPPISERLKRLGVSYSRYEMRDDIQIADNNDTFLSSRLVPASAVNSDFSETPPEWGGLHYVANVLEHDLLNAPLPELDWGSGTKNMQHYSAQRYLCAALSQDRLRAAVLAFWIKPDMPEQQALWEEESKKEGGKIHYMMFERLILQTESWSTERREELVQAALGLLQSYQEPYMMGWLRLAVMKFWLRTNKSRPRIKYSCFEQVKDAIIVLSLFLAKCLEVPDEQAWVRQVFARLKLGEPQWIELSADAVRMAVKQLQKIGLMYPPTLIKVWIHEWELVAAQRPQEVLQLNADALRQMCSLLDTPRPERLIAWFETPQLH